MPFLEVNNVSRHFGGLKALSEVSFSVNSRETIGIIGPNGAGKSTLFNVITGFLPPTKGQIILEDEILTGKKSHQIARRGVARLFQANISFGEFTVLQNILISSHMKSSMNLRPMLFSSSSIPESEMSRANEILEFAKLTHLKDHLAKSLPHGYQRILGVSMALGAEPRVLLLDEPVTGMNLDEMKTMTDLIRTLQSKGLTILLVEHNVGTVMDLCPRIIVLNFGRKIAEGSPDEIRRNKDVIEAYLGAETA